MQRRFNYTDRARLLHEDIRFTLKQEDDGWSFDVALEISDYELPEDSLVFIEAYRQTAWMRFAWGTVGLQTPPSNRQLTAFDSPEDILFRVKITSPGTQDEPHGLLLAEADRIHLRGPEETDESREPLLPVVPADLGDELWRVEFEEKPRLFINQNAGSDFRQIGKHPAFVAIVYPSAMREILTHILIVDGHRDFDDSDDPSSRWLRFAVQVLGAPEPPAEEDNQKAIEWINDAVAAFARKHAILETFKSFWAEEESA